MASYQIYCGDCDAECSVMIFERLEVAPTFCNFCGSELEDVNVREDSSEFSDDEEAWDKLSEESLGNIDDWKE